MCMYHGRIVEYRDMEPHSTVKIMFHFPNQHYICFVQDYLHLVLILSILNSILANCLYESKVKHFQPTVIYLMGGFMLAASALIMPPCNVYRYMVLFELTNDVKQCIYVHVYICYKINIPDSWFLIPIWCVPGITWSNNWLYDNQ